MRLNIETALDIDPKDLAVVAYQALVRATAVAEGEDSRTTHTNLLCGCEPDEYRRVDVECNQYHRYGTRHIFHMYVTESKE